MKQIELTKGLVALVDDEDYEWLSRYKWTASNKGKNGREKYYAVRQLGGRGSPQITMHRAIMNTPDGMVVDHLNGNSLDNRRCNLENVTHLENMRRTGKWKSLEKKEESPLVPGTLSQIDF